MNELVRHQARDPFAADVFAQRRFLDAVVARLVVLETEVRDVVAEREQPVVVAIVIRAEDGGGLVDQPSVLRREVVRRQRGLGAVGEKIQRVPVAAMADQIDLAQRRPI